MKKIRIWKKFHGKERSANKNYLNISQLTFAFGILFILVISSFVGVFYKEENINYKNSSNEQNIKIPEVTQNEKIKENLGKIKGHFTMNQGQLENDEIYFTYSSNDKTFGFLESSVLIKLSKEIGNNTKTSIIKISFENSNKVLPIGIEELNHKNNYFKENDPSKWASNVPNYERIVYENLYDGIDLIYYFNEKGLKYDWIIEPFADPNVIIERFEGIDSLIVDSNGAIIIKTETGELQEEKPYSYQKVLGNIVEVDVNFRLSEKTTLTYDIGNYDTSTELIIDPLIYSTYIPGSDIERGNGITIDLENNMYITGYTQSSDFPTTVGCFEDSYWGDLDIVVFKMSADGSNMIYSTYVAGSFNDTSNCISLDSENNAYVTGYTRSRDFPTTDGSYGRSYNGGSLDIFVFKLNSDGSDLLYSTYVGGTGEDMGMSITLDSENNAYITGKGNKNFPTTDGCYDDSYNEGQDIVVFKLKSDGSDLIYSTYVGGNLAEIGTTISLDSENNAYIGGYSWSKNFPMTIGCYDNTHDGITDVVVFKLNSEGSDLIYSTYVGGEFDEFLSVVGGRALALDSDNNVYITGQTSSSDFPTTDGCYDNKFNGVSDVIVFKLNSDGSDLLYSTFIGGIKGELGISIALDSDNNAYIAGHTSSPDFPTTDGCFSEKQGNIEGIVLKLNPDGSDLLYSTYFGDGYYYNTWVYGITLDSDNNAYITGHTCSPIFPTTYGSYADSKVEVNWDIFIFKLKLTELLTYAIIDNVFPNLTNKSEPVYFYGNGTTDEGTITEYQWFSNIDGSLSTEKSFSLINLSNGTHRIYFKVKNSNDVWSDWKSVINITVNGIPIAKIDKIEPNPALEGESIQFYGNYIDFEDKINEYYWESDIDGFFSNKKSFSTSTLSNGTHTISFKVKDDNDVWSESVSKILTINGLPRSKIDEIKPNPADEGENIWFYGNGTDDGIIEGYEWTSSIDGFLNDEKSFSLTNLSTGRHTIYFMVKDNFNIWSETISEMLVIGFPKAIINEIKPNPANENERIWFYGNGTDGWTIIEHYWYSSLDGFLNNDNSFNTTSLSNGTHTIFYKVKDNYDIWSKEVSTILTINGVPRATINDINPNFTNEGEDVWFYGIGKDDENVEDYNWSSNIDGFLSNETEFILKNLSNGTHTIYFKAIDNDDVWSEEDTKILTINGFPIAKINEIKPNIANEGVTILFSGTGTDDIKIDDYYWNSDIDGFLSNEKSFSLSNLSFGIHTIYFKVKDNNNVWSEEVFMTLTINGIPKAVINDITPNPALISKTVFFYGNGTDDGSIVSYHWYDSDGFLSNEKLFSLSNLSVGTHTISLKVQDNKGIWSEIVTDTLTIRDNKIPIARITSPLEGKEFYENETIHFDGEKSSDEDFDILTYSWMLNGEQISTKSKFEKILEIGKYLIELKVDDGFGGLASAYVNISVIDLIKSFLTLDENDIIIDGTPTVNEKIKISIKINNPGIINIKATIKFYIDKVDSDHLIGDEDISLLALKDLKVSTDWIPKTKGTCTIIVIIEKCEPEINIKDNTAQKTVEVKDKIKNNEEFVSRNPLIYVGMGLGAFLTLYIGGTEIGRYKFLTLFLLPLYMRLNKDDKDEILDNFVRGRIYEHIRKNPGTHYREIMKEMEVKNGVLSYHLGVLEKTGLIKSRNERGVYKAFYPTGMRFPEDEKYRLTEIQIDIIDKIKEEPGISQKEIASELELKQQNVNYNIRTLERAKKLVVKKKGRKSSCYIMHRPENPLEESDENNMMFS